MRSIQSVLERGDVALVQQEVPPQHAWQLTYEEDKGYEVWRYAVDANGRQILECEGFGINLNAALEAFVTKITESKNAQNHLL